MISIILPTLRRNPRFLEMSDSLTVAISASGLEVELVCVDGRLWYDADRREQLDTAVKGRFSTVHVPPKPSRWQGPTRLTRSDRWDKAGASNTGLIYANGEYIVFIDDCTMVNENFLIEHHKHLSLGRSTAGTYRYGRTGMIVENGKIVGGHFEDQGDHRLTFSSDEAIVAKAPGWMFGGNAGAPLDACLAINGFDEIISGQGGLEDSEFSIRMGRVTETWFLPKAETYNLTESHEIVGDNSTPHDGSWVCVCSHKTDKHFEFNRHCLEEGCDCRGASVPPAKPCKGFWLVDEAGTKHYMTDNHRPIYRLFGMRPVKNKTTNMYEIKHAEDLTSETTRIKPIGNHFDLRDLRSKVRRGEPLPIPDGPVRDWRDGQLLSEIG